MRRGHQFKAVYVVALVEKYGEGITHEQNLCMQASINKIGKRSRVQSVLGTYACFLHCFTQVNQ